MPPCHPGHFKKSNVASKMATKNMPVTNLAITMFYNPQNALFMHISSPVNAIEDDYVTLGYFVKSKMASKMANSRFILEMPYFSRFALFFAFFFFFFFF